MGIAAVSSSRYPTGYVMGTIESSDGVEFSFVVAAKEGIGELFIIAPGIGGPTREQRLIANWTGPKSMISLAIWGETWRA